MGTEQRRQPPPWPHGLVQELQGIGVCGGGRRQHGPECDRDHPRPEGCRRQAHVRRPLRRHRWEGQERQRGRHGRPAFTWYESSLFPLPAHCALTFHAPFSFQVTRSWNGTATPSRARRTRKCTMWSPNRDTSRRSSCACRATTTAAPAPSWRAPQRPRLFHRTRRIRSAPP